MYKSLLNSLNHTSSSNLNNTAKINTTSTSPSQQQQQQQQNASITNHKSQSKLFDDDLLSSSSSSSSSSSILANECLSSPPPKSTSNQNQTISTINVSQCLNALINGIQTSSSSSSSSSLCNLLTSKVSKFTDLIEKNLQLANERSEHLLYKQKEADQLEMSKRRADLNHRQRLQDMLCKCLSQSSGSSGSSSGSDVDGGLNLSERIHYLNECLNGGALNKKNNNNINSVYNKATTNKGNLIGAFFVFEQD
jgi:hypothetical protein